MEVIKNCVLAINQVASFMDRLVNVVGSNIKPWPIGQCPVANEIYLSSEVHAFASLTLMSVILFVCYVP